MLNNKNHKKCALATGPLLTQTRYRALLKLPVSWMNAPRNGATELEFSVILIESVLYFVEFGDGFIFLFPKVATAFTNRRVYWSRFFARPELNVAYRLPSSSFPVARLWEFGP